MKSLVVNIADGCMELQRALLHIAELLKNNPFDWICVGNRTFRRVDDFCFTFALENKRMVVMVDRWRNYSGKNGAL